MYFFHIRYNINKVLQKPETHWLNKLNASTQVEPLHDDKVITGKSHKFYSTINLQHLRHDYYIYFFTFILHKHKKLFQLFFFFIPEHTSDMAKNVNFRFGCKFAVSRLEGIFECRRRYSRIGSLNTLAYAWSQKITVTVFNSGRKPSASYILSIL